MLRFFSALINSLPGLIGFLSDESDFRTALEVCRVTLLHRRGVGAFQFRLNDDDDDDDDHDDDDDDDDEFWIAQTLVKSWVNLNLFIFTKGTRF